MPHRADHTQLVAAACRRLETSQCSPRVGELAAEAGLSPGEFHRVFRRVAGVTPGQYAAACRAARLQQGLRTGARVTQAILDAGYGSLGRAYEATSGRLGMTPSRYGAGGPGETIRHAATECHLGAVAIGVTERGLAAIELADTPEAALERLRTRFPEAHLQTAEHELADLLAQVVHKIDRPASDLDLPLDIRGTAFQERVWRALQAIPAGETRTYGDIARTIDHPQAARAVGSAVAANSLAVAIPCHRVLPANATVGQYRWGSDRKRRLLAREARQTAGDPED